jgi:hypothetical protein
MKQVHLSSVALLLAVTTSAWAGVEPYPEAVQGQDMSSMTRAQVITELHEAIRLGQMYDYPMMYAQAQMLANAGEQAGGAVVSRGDQRQLRAKVSAEAAEANRLGLLSSGEGKAPVATAAQEGLIAAAGERAASHVQLTRQVTVARPGEAVDAWTESR